MGRFKIDYNVYGSASYFVALFVRRECGFFGRGTKWEQIESFRTIAEARELYARIKDLPEYLA